MNLTEKKESCSGCGACRLECPRGAIKIVPDALGFPYPEIDSGLCIECGKCLRECAFKSRRGEAGPAALLKGRRVEVFPDGIHNGPRSVVFPDSFAVRHKSGDVVDNSRSGGMFTAISDYVLSLGGVVYGAAFDESFGVVHRRASNASQRDSFRGSKYVQSDISDCFESVRADLEAGLTVLFSGTPCECDALRSYVGEKYDAKLYVVDIVCHGVPSPAVWKAYLGSFGREIESVEFRDKRTFGWKDHRETIRFKDGSSKSSRLFTYLFYRHIMMRPSCSECPYTNLQRPSDITLADFWGWEKQVPEMNRDDRGLSLVLVSSRAGHELLEAARASCEVVPVDVIGALQRPLQEAAPADSAAAAFERDFLSKGIRYVMRKYGDMRPGPRLKYLYKSLRCTARRVLRRDG